VEPWRGNAIVYGPYTVREESLTSRTYLGSSTAESRQSTRYKILPAVFGTHVRQLGLPLPHLADFYEISNFCRIFAGYWALRRL
jgi:hypothetical protein